VSANVTFAPASAAAGVKITESGKPVFENGRFVGMGTSNSSNDGGVRGDSSSAGVNGAVGVAAGGSGTHAASQHQFVWLEIVLSGDYFFQVFP
jgi:hypothetical protein